MFSVVLVLVQGGLPPAGPANVATLAAHRLFDLPFSKDVCHEMLAQLVNGTMS